jgi:OPT family oligopeptide transporter
MASKLSAAQDSRSGSDEKKRADSDAPYREVTFAGVLLGVVVGVVMTVSFTYAGLKLGFTVPASMVSAMLGWGVLRGLLKKGSIVENNINQTVAAAINVSSAGVIFTVPVLYLMQMEAVRSSARVIAAAQQAGITADQYVLRHPELQSIDAKLLWAMAGASLAGALLGVLFIIPSRKQMIELERLVFPTGVATATILKASASGAKRARMLGVGIATSVIFATIVGLPGVIPSLPWPAIEDFSISEKLHIPAWFAITIAVSGGLTSVGGGFITGRAGLVLMVGAVIGHWIVTPLVVTQGWMPATVQHAAPEVLGAWAYRNVTRPLGVGMLLGGSLASVILTAPMLLAAIRSIKQQRQRSRGNDELDPRWMYAGIAAGFVILAIAAKTAVMAMGDTTIGTGAILFASLVATAWMWLANIIVSITTGKTDNSPLSGMALITILLILTALGRSQAGIMVAMVMAVAVCVATGQGSDMMQDLKTGHLVGALPRRQQLTQLAVAWIGPLISLVTLVILAKKFVFGQNPLTAPQAQAIRAAIDLLAPAQDASPLQNVIAEATRLRYAVGAAVGLTLTLGAGGGLGVVLGLSMYLPMSVTLTYCIGCAVAVWTEKKYGREWIEDVGVPLSAGWLVGEGLALVVIVAIDLARVALKGGA